MRTSRDQGALDPPRYYSKAQITQGANHRSVPTRRIGNDARFCLPFQIYRLRGRRPKPPIRLIKSLRGGESYYSTAGPTGFPRGALQRLP